MKHTIRFLAMIALVAYLVFVMHVDGNIFHLKSAGMAALIVIYAEAYRQSFESSKKAAP